MKDIQKLDEVRLRSIARGGHGNFVGRTFVSESKFNRGMASILGRFFKELQRINTDSCLPYFIFNLEHDRNLKEYILEYVGVRYETEGISLVDTRKRFTQAQDQFRDDLETMLQINDRLDQRIKYAKKLEGKHGGGHEHLQRLKDKKEAIKEEGKKLSTQEANTTVSYGLIGYDTEYQIEPLSDEQRELLQKIKDGEVSKDDVKDRPMQIKTLLSHQFCIDVLGKRLAFVICTEERFTDEWFLDFLGTLVRQLSKFQVKQYYIFAHFSLAEASLVG